MSLYKPVGCFDRLDEAHWLTCRIPIGQRILIGNDVGPEVEEPLRRIVGVVADVRDLGLNRDLYTGLSADRIA